jgi:hypothetical protein
MAEAEKWRQKDEKEIDSSAPIFLPSLLQRCRQ